MFSTFALRSNFNVDTFRLVYCVQLTCLNRFILMFYCVLLVQRLILIALFCFHGQTPILNQILLDVLTFLMPVFNGDPNSTIQFPSHVTCSCQCAGGFCRKRSDTTKMGRVWKSAKIQSKKCGRELFTRWCVYTWHWCCEVRRSWIATELFCTWSIFMDMKPGHVAETCRFRCPSSIQTRRLENSYDHSPLNHELSPVFHDFGWIILPRKFGSHKNRYYARVC